MEKKLYRSKRQQVIAGVCGGIGEYFGVDVTLIRLGWALLILIGGTGLLLYIICAIVIPKAPDSGSETVIRNADGTEMVIREQQDAVEPSANNQFLLIAGLGLMVLGAWTLFTRVLPRDIIRELRGFGWPLILIVIGAAVMYSAFRKQ